ncbi:hypothetical protein D3C86_1305630 [compost metagenome]
MFFGIEIFEPWYFFGNIHGKSWGSIRHRFSDIFGIEIEGMAQKLTIGGIWRHSLIKFFPCFSPHAESRSREKTDYTISRSVAK